MEPFGAKCRLLGVNRRTFVGLAMTSLAAGMTTACAPQATVEPRTATAAFRAARRFVDTPFGKIAYVERGSGDAALFLHGFPLNGFQWRGALERLSPHRRCVAPDFMSMGYSEVPAGQSVAAAAQAAMLAAFLDQLGIPVVDVVANDSGGAAAQLFIARYPARVRTVLLSNCDVESDSPPSALMPSIERGRAGTWVDQWLLPQFTDKEFARSSKGLGSGAYTDPKHLTDEAIDFYFGPMVSSPLRKAQGNAFAAALLPNPLLGITPQLQRCTAPMRVVWGTGDTVFSAASPDYLDRTFPRSRGVRRVPGAKLFFPEELPDIIAEEARQLWGVS